MQTWGKNTGPWLTILGRKIDRRDLGGRRFAVRLVLDQQSGIFFNVAAIGMPSLVAGWYPDHKKAGCSTGFGVVLAAGEEPVVRHRCWARKLDWSLGPDPSEMRKAVV